jgi:hypothetical protein
MVQSEVRARFSAAETKASFCKAKTMLCWAGDWEVQKPGSRWREETKWGMSFSSSATVSRQRNCRWSDFKVLTSSDDHNLTITILPLPFQNQNYMFFQINSALSIAWHFSERPDDILRKTGSLWCNTTGTFPQKDSKLIKLFIIITRDL